MERTVTKKIDRTMFQTVILTLSDGRKANFTGPAQLFDGDSIVKVDATVAMPLPKGQEWEMEVSL